MKNLRRLLTLCLLVGVIVSCMACLSSCYIIKSGKMSEIEGTYELTNYSRRENMIEANSISLYMVIKADGTGYYAYSDKDTKLHYSALRCRYTPDSQEAGKYSYVEIDFDGTGDWDNFGVNVSAKSLTFKKPVYKGNLFDGDLAIDYYIDATFKRIDKSTDLSYLKNKLGDAITLPYGALRLDGTYFCSGIGADSAGYEPLTEPDTFVYFYLDIDLVERAGKAWYMLTSDEIERTAEFTVGIDEGSDGAYSLTLGDKSVSAMVNGSYAQYIRIPYPLGEYADAYIEECFSGDKTESEILSDIDFAKLSYENQKADTVN